MKRRVKERRKTPVRIYDVRAELPKETLAAFGSCTLIFNEMQASLDTLLCLCLNVDPIGWRELTTRIGGLDHKTELCNFWLANTVRETLKKAENAPTLRSKPLILHGSESATPNSSESP